MPIVAILLITLNFLPLSAETADGKNNLSIQKDLYDPAISGPVQNAKREKVMSKEDLEDSEKKQMSY